jgi:phosphoglycolate phosphatase
LRVRHGAQGSPLFPGALDVLMTLNADPETLLAVATGKSMRGLNGLIDSHGLEGVFVSRQVADHHPSKPHPSMIHACLSETGVAPEHAVMIGDTSFDMDMARAAGVSTIGVSWGYHAVHKLDADVVVDHFADLPRAIDQLVRIDA